MGHEKPVRQSNIELLRIVLMMMIIMHHLITRGCGLRNIIEENFSLENSPFILLLINSIVIFGVNTFVFISGYFGIRFSLKKLLSFIFQAFFFSLSIYLIFLLTGIHEFSIKEFIRTCFPVLFGRWWFVTCFIALYGISPILNKGLEALSKKELLFSILILFYIGNILFIPTNNLSGSGFSLYNFIVIYMTGFYMRRFMKDIKYPEWIFIACISILFVLSSSAFYFGYPTLAWNIFSYNNPILIIGAISLFYIFKKIDITSTTINKLSIYVFGVYLFHEHVYIHPEITSIVEYLNVNIGNEVLFYACLMILMVIIFFIGCLVDRIRLSFSNLILNKIEI